MRNSSVLLFAAFIGLTMAFESTICQTSTQFSFKSTNAAGGVPSAITAPMVNLSMVFGEALPPIIIETKDVPDGTVVRVTVRPTPVLLSGDTAEVILGVAYFPGLTLADNLPVDASLNTTALAWLSFDATDVNGQSYNLRTGYITQLDSTTAAQPREARLLHYGFLRLQSAREIPNGSPLGEFFVGAYDALGRLVLLDGTARVALANNYNGSVTTTSTSYPGNGAIGITGVTFTGGTEKVSFAITVTIGSWSATTYSEELTVALAELTSNGFMEFDRATSFITIDNQGANGVMKVALPPIVINLLKSDRTADTSNTGMVIQATASQGVLVGAQALVQNGVAKFSTLYFDDDGTGAVPPAPVITFQVSPLEGKVLTLVSGIISLASDVIRGKQMRFAPWSELTSLAPTKLAIDATGVVSLPYTAIRMYDSAFALDHESDGFNLVMSADPPNILTPVNQTTVTCTVRFGLCVMPHPVFRAINPKTASGRSVRFVVKDNTGLSARNPLTTNDVALATLSSLTTRGDTPQGVFTLCRTGSSGCLFTIDFVDDFSKLSSVVYANDVAFSATVGTPIGTIRLRLSDAVGPLTNLSNAFVAQAPVLYAHTGDFSGPDTPDAYLRDTNGARAATLSHSGEYRFDCLVFDTLPVGLVRIQFTAFRQTYGVFDLLYARTGFLRVVSAPTSLYQLQFGKSTGSLQTPPVFARPLQGTTAVANVDLPPIIVEVADSLGVVDTGDASLLVTVVVTATDSVGTVSSKILDTVGSSADVINGQAVFQSLRLITATYDDVTLTFTATKAATALSTAAIVGQTISSGIITVSQWPQRAATHMDLVASPSAVPDGATAITSAAQAFTVVNLTNFDAYAEFTFRDSMHTVLTPELLLDSRWGGALDGITARVLSDQVRFPVDVFNVDPACACLRVRLSEASFAASVFTSDLIYLTLEVDRIGDKGNPYLMRHQFPIGPITVTSKISASASCSAGTSVASVFGEFALPAETFDSTTVLSDLGLVMGVDPARVTFDSTTLVDVQRVDHSTLARWKGSKVKMSFLDPRPGDLNRKPGSSLATEIIGYRADCGPQGFLLRSAHSPALDHPCDTVAFDQQAANATQCIRMGNDTYCACYAYGLLSPTGQGPRCIVERGSALSTLCVMLTNCADAAIVDVCSNVPVQTRNYTGLYVSVGLIAFLSAVGGLFLHWKRREAAAAKRSLSA